MLGARLTELPVFPALLLSAVKRLGLYLLCSLHGGSNAGAGPRTGANALHFHPARTRKVVGNNQSTSCDSESRGSESLTVEGPLLRAQPLSVCPPPLPLTHTTTRQAAGQPPLCAPVEPPQTSVTLIKPGRHLIHWEHPGSSLNAELGRGELHRSPGDVRRKESLEKWDSGHMHPQTTCACVYLSHGDS